MENYIIIGIFFLVVGGAIWYIVRAKKRGQKCVGCPESTCPGKGGEGCCCGAKDAKK